MKIKHWILPGRVALDLVRDGANATMTYSECFVGLVHPKTGKPASKRIIRAIVARTVGAIKHRVPVGMEAVISEDGMSVTITGTTDYQTAAQMLAGEFLCWTSIMEVTLRDLLLGSVVAA